LNSTGETSEIFGATEAKAICKQPSASAGLASLQLNLRTLENTAALPAANKMGGYARSGDITRMSLAAFAMAWLNTEIVIGLAPSPYLPALRSGFFRTPTTR
jgi:hypothetical protein